MVDWPGPNELKQVLDVESDDWDDNLDRALSAAIYQVKHQVGQWDEATDEPDDSLAAAALRMAELLATRPASTGSVIAARAAANSLSGDPTFTRLMFGHRQRFAFS